jgi:hypothetical protein
VGDRALHSLLTLCTGCNLCRASTSYVHVGSRQRLAETEPRPNRLIGVESTLSDFGQKALAEAVP